MDKPFFTHFIRKWLPAMIIIMAALSLSIYFLTNKPKSIEKPAEVNRPLVTTIKTKVIDHQVTIQAMGTVIPAKQINLTSRINGMVTEVSPNFIPGSILKKGEKIVQLDTTDYKLAVIEKQNLLAQAEFNLTLEQGQQAIAQREFNLLNADLDEQSQTLVLRKPHLKLAKSNVAAAEAALKQAQLNLKRTKTVSPFNAIVLSTNAHIGSWVSTFSTGTPLVKLAGTDSFWVVASVPVNNLTKIKIPSPASPEGSNTKIYYPSAWGGEAYRQGTVKRLKAELESSGRMAEVIIEIDDPFNLKAINNKQPIVILDSFVSIKIKGNLLKNVISIPETALHAGNLLWLLNNNNSLEIKKVTPLWKEQGKLFISANELKAGTQIIMSYINTPVTGMQLRLSNHAK